ncbi:gamma-glutamyl-gamma-aminobutyrate hydrolase family protein [Streptococcus cuniculipharyngis]|uniref:Gamma-glutamyl-gamma-aminobutyrate hydrolase family protein n=1 Tax=Streptococcus cuniculipharyngis TaxID=1562651 RepID=A0A5C5SFY9_9STRE|nr:gamma-glutamyl-gamma-aminobutyrate hydrolase family protein [Streptococcus cuniculipharyngis]TWS98925.1 gamma-glutamyl-gamma-aminobutyrate hydrolase family protein [Streptococcus cuniculipharyngis]
MTNKQKQPIIGITGNQRTNLDNTTPDGINISYTATGFVEGVKRVGGLPLIIPISKPESAHIYINLIDKLILTGGQNVLPEFYGEVNQTNDCDFLRERDEFELALIKAALEQKKPIFSVCRGTQLMNVALGGNLNQVVENHWQDHPSDYLSQDMAVKPDSILASIYGQKTAINSFHHQSIKDLAPGLEIIAHDPKDGTIEAVTNSQLHFLGVQWHPELLYGHRNEDLALFDYVVNHL